MTDTAIWEPWGGAPDPLQMEEAARPPRYRHVAAPIKIADQRKKMLVDMLGTSLEYGGVVARRDGLYADNYSIPQEDIIPGADRWLQNESGFTYNELIELLEVADMQDDIDWAWSLQGAPTVQLDTASNVVGFLNLFSAVIDYGHAAWDLTSGDVSGARDAWDNVGDRLYGYDPNPYGSQVANVLGVHNWQDAIWAGFDLIDVISLGFGGEIIQPMRQAMAAIARRQGRPEAARAIERRLAEEFAERASHMVRGGDEAADAAARAVRSLDELDQVAVEAWGGGPPLFHGSSAVFDEFDPSLMNLDLGWGRIGVYTSNMDWAGGVARETGFVHNVRFRPNRTPRIVELRGPIPDDIRAVLRAEVEELRRTFPEVDSLTGDESISALLAKIENPDSNLAGVIWGADVHGTTPTSITTTIGRFGADVPEEAYRTVLERIQRAIQEKGVDGYREVNPFGKPDPVFIWLNPSDLEVVETGASNVAGGVARETGEAAADAELRTVWDSISTGEREVIEADYRAVFPDADPDPADMMRWYEQQGPPGTPEDWMYYTDRSGRKQYKGAGAFENPAGHDIQKVKDELGWTDDQFDQAKAAWANDPQRIEDQVAREAERLDMDLAGLNPDPTVELLEWSDLDD